MSFFILKSLSVYIDKQSWEVDFITDSLKISSFITALSRANCVPILTGADEAYLGKVASGWETQRSALSLGAKLTSHLWALDLTSFSLSYAKDKDISDSRMRLRGPNPEMETAQGIRCQFSQKPWLWRGGTCRHSPSLTTGCLWGAKGLAIQPASLKSCHQHLCICGFILNTTHTKVSKKNAAWMLELNLIWTTWYFVYVVHIQTAKHAHGIRWHNFHSLLDGYKVWFLTYQCSLVRSKMWP